MKVLALTLALVGAAGLGASAPQDDPALRSSGWELRVYVLDKTTLQSVDLKDWSAELVIEPRGGKEQKVALEKAGMAKDALPRRDEKPKVEAKPAMPWKPMICGQVKDMDPYYVELAVVHAGWMEKGHKRPDAFPNGNGNDRDQEGYHHTHGGPYFKANLPRSWWTDAKQMALAFDGDVHFTFGTEKKDKKSVKGFSYPFGLYKDVLQKVMDEDLKQARDHAKAGDAAKWKEVSERIMAKAHALPDLTFKKNEDREEFERGKRDCLAACERLRTATTKEQATEAIDQCADKCDDYQDEAQDAEGVTWESKRAKEPHKPAERK